MFMVPPASGASSGPVGPAQLGGQPRGAVAGQHDQQIGIAGHRLADQLVNVVRPSTVKRSS